jgi:oxygen-independent coproporphyrinogen-3 oxidase
VTRQVRFRDPAKYMAQALSGQPIAQDDEVARDQLPFEFMLNALRRTAGVPAALFAERTGLSLAAAASAIAEATRKGLLEPDPAVLRATPLGRRFLNDLQALFLPDARVARRPKPRAIAQQVTAPEGRR